MRRRPLLSFILSLSSCSLSLPPNAVSVSGTFKNFNTIEDFKNADKAALFNHVADETWKSIVEERSTAHLTRFLLITFADLKKYKYYYWFAFPAFVAKPAWEIDGDWQSAGEALDNDTVSAGLFIRCHSLIVCPAFCNLLFDTLQFAPFLSRPHVRRDTRNCACRRSRQIL